MRLLLDTHAWIWASSAADLLSKPAREALEKVYSKDGEILLSRISIWEVAKLFQKGRFKTHVALETWITQSIESIGIEVIELETPIILDSVSLPGEFHSDPADQLIVATARVKNATLITKDDLIRRYPSVKTVW